MDLCLRGDLCPLIEGDEFVVFFDGERGNVTVVW